MEVSDAIAGISTTYKTILKQIYLICWVNNTTPTVLFVEKEYLVYFCGMKKVFVLQGSNEGNRKEFLDLSLTAMETQLGKISCQSSIYESEPWGFYAQQWFLNRVVVFESELQPLSILNTLMTIESKLGRKRVSNKRYHSRSIDLDVLFVDHEIIDIPTLTVPHPQIQHRRFTLLPLVEIAPHWIHPKLNQSVLELLDSCPDGGKVHLYIES
jgi:2-amino-4-hydroxy-6-hydroxymethyldihydropteridine diphosphokinase